MFVLIRATKLLFTTRRRDGHFVVIKCGKARLATQPAMSTTLRRVKQQMFFRSHYRYYFVLCVVLCYEFMCCGPCLLTGRNYAGADTRNIIGNCYCFK